MQQLIDQSLKSLTLTNDLFLKTFAKPSIFHLLNSLAIHLLLGKRGSTSQKYAFFVLQLFYRLAECENSRRNINLSVLLDLAVIGSFHYSPLYLDLLRNYNSITEDEISVFFHQISTSQSDQYKRSLENELVFCKIHIFVSSFPEHSSLFLEPLVNVLSENRSLTIQSILINILELPSFYIPSSSSHSTLLSQSKESLLCNAQFKSIQMISSQHPLLPTSLIESLFYKSNCIETECLQLLSAKNYESFEYSELLQFITESAEPSNEQPPTELSQKVKDLTLASLYESSDDELTLLQTEYVENVGRNEEVLFSCAIKHPEVFERTARRSQLRKEMIEKTGLSHEQLEGWYLMLKRNPKREVIMKNYEMMFHKSG